MNTRTEKSLLGPSMAARATPTTSANTLATGMLAAGVAALVVLASDRVVQRAGGVIARDRH